MKSLLLFCALVLSGPCLWSQSEIIRKELSAFRTAQKIKIDGHLDEADWSKAEVANDFFWRFPNAGKPATSRTEARILYDDNSIYVGIHCFDAPDSVSRPLNKRDELSNSDWAGIVIDAYRDGQNALEFDVMASNVQYDSKYSVASADENNGNGDGEDPSWDGVWRSGAAIVADGWIAEIEIPYATLRFPKKPVQQWGINFLRSTFRKGKQDCWSRAMPDRLFIPQTGILSGIKDIKAPLRLSATPFVATNFQNHFDRSADPSSLWSRTFSAGMDVKYGLNEAFTLDATLIPDFSQVRSDNRVLNLSPFEVRFNENRPFFMEGTELFNKGGLFYSRRIGGRAIDAWKAVTDTASGGFLLPGEETVSNPINVQLLNATKISGRTQKGLGIGVFNAIEAPAYAELRNADPASEHYDEVRRVQTASLTDKNLVVFDQNLPHNSFVTFTNALTARAGSAADANASAINFSLRDKKNAYRLTGRGALTQRFEGGSVDRGHSWSAQFGKTSGKWNWQVETVEESARYNPNDLGFLYSPNEQNALAWVNYNQYEKRKRWNNWWASAWVFAGRYYAPRKFQTGAMGFNMGGNTPKTQNMGFNLNYAPWGEYDYFGTFRADFSRYFKEPPRLRANFWFSTDQRKKWQVFINGYGRKNAAYGMAGGGSAVGATIRIGEKLSAALDLGLDLFKNDIGFALPAPDERSIGYESLDLSNDIVFGKRNIVNWDNGLSLTYSFNNKMSLSFRSRHYWSRVRYQDFFLLAQDGGLAPTAYKGKEQLSDPSTLHDQLANYFNIDCVFTWRFAPGSDLIAVWKNASYNEDNLAESGYLHSLSRVPGLPQTNTLSLKALYWLDYSAVKKKLK